MARPFIDALRAGLPMCTAEEGRVAAEMIRVSYQAAETERRVSL